MGGELLIRIAHRQTLQGGGGLTIHLHDPGLETSKGPAPHHRGEGVAAAGLLFHRQVGQQRGAAVSKSQQTVVQASLLTQMNLQHVAVGSVSLSRHHLQQIQLRLFFHQQQHPCRRQPRRTCLQKLQRRH